MEKAEVLTALIKETGLSKRAFAEKIGLPATTLQSMLSRGVGGAAIDNVIKVCKGLNITTDTLEDMADPVCYNGRAIKEVREKQGVTKKGLSDAVGISEWKLSQIESDEIIINGYLLRKIVAQFGMSFFDFLNNYCQSDWQSPSQFDGDTNAYLAFREVAGKDILSEAYDASPQQDEDVWTEAELQIINQFKNFLKSLRNKT